MKRILSVILAVVTSLNAITFPVAAADPVSCVVSVYNDRNGLPTGEANAVVQTPDGYIWIGSYAGLIRYDGTEFRNFSDEGLIPTSTVRSLYVDTSGRLWIGSNDKGVFVRENGSFIQPEGQPDDSILCIRSFTENSGGDIIVASSTGMACISSGKMKVFDDEQIKGVTFYSAAVDKYGRIWGLVNSGAVVLSADGRLMDHISSDVIFPDESIYCFSTGCDGVVWCGSDGKTVARIDFTGQSLSGSDISIELINAGRMSTINSIVPMPDGSAMINALNGFGIIDPDGNLTEFDETQSAASVMGSCIDYEGSAWLASSTNGIIQYTQGSFVYPGLKSDLSDYRINTLTESHGLFYLGTDKGLLIYDNDWNPVSNELTDRLDGIRVRNIICGSDGRVWIASYSHTPVLCFDPDSGSVSSWSEESGLIDDSARVLTELSDGTVAVGTQNGENLIRLDGTVEQVEGLGHIAILCMLETADGSLLIGTDGGGIYELKNGVLSSFGSGNPASGVILRMIRDSEEGCYFISTGSGLVDYDGTGYRALNNLDKQAGNIFDMYLRDGKLYCLQNSGIMAFERQDVIDDNGAAGVDFGFNDGLSGSLFANTWNWLSPDGSLYISTRNGVSVFDFQQPKSVLPKCIVNQVTVDNKVYEHPEAIMIPHDARRISIDYAALSYSNSARLTASCSLEGFDNEQTVQTSRSGTLSYTNLPGGSYTFRMRVCLTDDPDSFTEYTVKIDKGKSLLEQNWFRALIILAFLLATVSITMLCLRARIKKIKHHQEEYQDMLEQTLKTFGGTIDAKDKYTNGHSLRVAQYSKEIARRMNWTPAQQEHIYYVALLHDIGKIGVPDSILTKPGKLTDEERSVIQQHPAIGGNILKNFTAIKDIADGAKYHHERYDGGGYNAGLKGEEIPLIARIIAVADTYDAMSSRRCYRNSLPSDVIIAELNRVAGTQLDPNIVPYMIAMIEDGTAPIILPEQNNGE